MAWLHFEPLQLLKILTSMRIRIKLSTVMRIRIQLPEIMRVWINNPAYNFLRFSFQRLFLSLEAERQNLAICYHTPVKDTYYLLQRWLGLPAVLHYRIGQRTCQLAGGSTRR
jgi:hypothetical protein